MLTGRLLVSVLISAGMVYTNPDSAYIRLLKPFLEKKKRYVWPAMRSIRQSRRLTGWNCRMGVDKWGRDDSQVKHIYEPLIKHLKEEIPERFQKKRYPQHWGLEGHVHRVLRELLVSELLSYEFASYFEGKSFEELDELAASFKLENCVKRDGLNEILRKDAGMQ